MKNSIAVIGQGFVGGTLSTVMIEKGFGVYAFDKKQKYVNGVSHLWNTYCISDFVKHAERQDSFDQFSKIYFVCVPTPMKSDGSCDTSIVENVLKNLAEVPGERIAVIKSTVPPGSTENWNNQFKNLHIIFCPEFLTEANALDDMRNQTRIILGGPRPHINKVKQIFQTAFPKVPIVKTSSTTAEMTKYFTNVFLATKVSLANELSQICEVLDKNGFNIDYDKVVEYAKLDSRLGTSHWQVPGPDGHKGYGGSCFNKDINALIFLAKQLDVDPKVLNAVEAKNLEVRPERDWEQLIGRAITEKK